MENNDIIKTRAAIGSKSNFPLWMQNLSCVTGEKEKKVKYSSRWRSAKK
jgi:hypothetical protein